MNETCKTPWEDQINRALEHYEDVSSKAHHWNSLVPAAIRAYQEPDTPTKEERFLQFIDERIQKSSSAVSEAAYEIVKRHFKQIFKVDDTKNSEWFYP